VFFDAPFSSFGAQGRVIYPAPPIVPSYVQDRVIWAMYASLGARWAEIAKFLVGRTENSVKNRFYAAARKVRGWKGCILLW
jgi:hypothetical protein